MSQLSCAFRAAEYTTANHDAFRPQMWTASELNKRSISRYGCPPGPFRTDKKLSPLGSSPITSPLAHAPPIAIAPSTRDTGGSSRLAKTGWTTGVWAPLCSMGRSWNPLDTGNGRGAMVTTGLLGKDTSTRDTGGSSCLAKTGWTRGVWAPLCSTGRWNPFGVANGGGATVATGLSGRAPTTSGESLSCGMVRSARTLRTMTSTSCGVIVIGASATGAVSAWAGADTRFAGLGRTFVGGAAPSEDIP